MRVVLCALLVFVFASIQHQVVNGFGPSQLAQYNDQIISLNETCVFSQHGTDYNLKVGDLIAVAGSYTTKIPPQLCGSKNVATATVGCLEVVNFWLDAGYSKSVTAACPPVNQTEATYLVSVTGKLSTAVEIMNQDVAMQLKYDVENLDIGTRFSIVHIKVNGSSFDPEVGFNRRRRETDPGTDVTILLSTMEDVDAATINAAFEKIEFTGTGDQKVYFQNLESHIARGDETEVDCANGKVYFDDKHGYCKLNTTNSSWCKAIAPEFNDKDCDTFDTAVKHIALTQCKCHDVCHAVSWCNTYVWDNATTTDHGDRCHMYPHVFDDSKTCEDHGYTFTSHPSKNQFITTGGKYELDPDKAIAVGAVGAVGAVASFGFSAMIHLA
jgi:hypothetical protein